MKILALAGSNSRRSRNKQLVSWVAEQFPEDEIMLLDLNDFEMPLFGVDRQKEMGIPPLAYAFARHIDEADLLLISLAEHNGAYSAAFKNLFDWVSRIPERSVFENKPIFLMATSTGRRGGSTVLTIAEQRFPFNGGEILDTFSLPSFKENFVVGKGIVDDYYRNELLEKVGTIRQKLRKQLPATGSEFAIGQPAPAWALESIFGDPVPEVSHFAGKPLLILFFNLGCPGCVGRAVPFANRVVFEERGVQVVGIHTQLDGPEYEKEKLKAAKEELYIRFPYYRDRAYAQTFWKYRAAGTPHWVLLDEHSVVTYALFGSEPNNALLRLDLKMTELVQ